MKLEALSRGLSHGSFGLLVSFCLIVRAGHYLRNFDWSRSTLHISVSFLQDLLTRVQYLQNFIAFFSSDAAALHYLRSVVTPLVPAVLDAVYEKQAPVVQHHCQIIRAPQGSPGISEITRGRFFF